METITPEKLSELGEKWLETKIQRMKNLLKIAEPDEALYREIMLSLGYPKNKSNFLELALLLPYSEMRRLKDRETIEKALLYRAGFSEEKDGIPTFFDFSLRMNRSVWEYKGIRPNNFPEKRIIGITDLLEKGIDKGLVNFFEKNIKASAEDRNLKVALKSIMNFSGIGSQRKEEMFFNIIMPFMMIYSKDEVVLFFLRTMFETYPPLGDNNLLKKFKAKYPYLELKTLREYMGALFFQKNLNTD
ncbi:MAG: DUF2851 family protein [Candidatus Altiarchaeota archaeon]